MRLVLLGSAFVLLSACSKSPPEPEKQASTTTTTTTTTSAPSGAGAKSAAPVGVDDVAWDAPASWTSTPNTNAMRKATYKIAKASGDAEDAELTVSAAQGGVEANVKRWAGQFSGGGEPKTEQRTPNGLKVTVVELKGTFASGGGMMGGPTTPKEKFMLLGAIVDGGERQHFFKMTGPEKTVTAAKKDFDALVSSLRAK